MAQNTVTLLAPSKTYNIAGLECSFAVVQNPQLRKRLNEARLGLVHGANMIGYIAATAAYRDGQPWLDVLLAVPAQSTAPADEGRRRAARYFFHYELPKIGAWLRVVETRDPTCASMPEESF